MVPHPRLDHPRAAGARRSSSSCSSARSCPDRHGRTGSASRCVGVAFVLRAAAPAGRLDQRLTNEPPTAPSDGRTEAAALSTPARAPRCRRGSASPRPSAEARRRATEGGSRSEAASADRHGVGPTDEPDRSPSGAGRQARRGVDHPAGRHAAATWFNGHEPRSHIGTLVDGQSVLMLVVVTLISLLVHIYSTDYVNGDRRYTHYFAFLSLFTASMLFFVLAENTLQMIVGWELVGVCSFALIGHWWEEKPNSDAALKAFLTNRVGDMGLLDRRDHPVLRRRPDLRHHRHQHQGQRRAGSATRCCWSASLLPDRGGHVEVGPVHPAHLAARRHGRPDAGLRAHPRRHHGRGRHLHGRPPVPGVLRGPRPSAARSINLLAVVGAVTALFGALLAFVQKDIKKVLAYSTVSQLGFMVTRARRRRLDRRAVPPLHPRHVQGLPVPRRRLAQPRRRDHSFDMVDDMGGLRKNMPKTFWTYLIGTLALVGHLPVRRLLVEGRDPGRHRQRRTTASAPTTSC